jgi:hypothetical protein
MERKVSNPKITCKSEARFITVYTFLSYFRAACEYTPFKPTIVVFMLFHPSMVVNLSALVKRFVFES